MGDFERKMVYIPDQLGSNMLEISDDILIERLKKEEAAAQQRQHAGCRRYFSRNYHNTFTKIKAAGFCADFVVKNLSLFNLKKPLAKKIKERKEKYSCSYPKF